MTPDQLANSGSEHSEQIALFCWAALNVKKYPQLRWMFAVPNGGFRFKQEAARLKASGVKAGVPDILLPFPKDRLAGLFIEMKRKVVGRLQDNQGEWIAYLRSVGYRAEVCYGWQEAVKVIEDYLNG